MAELKEILAKMQDYMNLNNEYSITTQKKYLNIIRLFLIESGFKFNIETINRFISRRNNKSNCYVYKFAFKSFLTSIGKKQWYYELKSVKRKPRKKIFKHIDKVTIQQMINLLPSKYRFMALLQLKTGCRFIELATLRAENIEYDVHPQLIYIKLGEGLSQAKGAKARLARLHKKYEGIMRKLARNNYGYVFLNRDCEGLGKEEIYYKLENLKRYYNKELQKVGEMFGVVGFSSHYLRHLFADEFIMKGGTIEALKVILGHAKLDTTIDYVSIGDKMADKTLVEMG